MSVLIYVQLDPLEPGLVPIPAKCRFRHPITFPTLLGEFQNALHAHSGLSGIEGQAPQFLADVSETLRQRPLLLGSDVVWDHSRERLLCPNAALSFDLGFLDRQPLALLLEAFVQTCQFVYQRRSQLVSFIGINRLVFPHCQNRLLHIVCWEVRQITARSAFVTSQAEEVRIAPAIASGDAIRKATLASSTAERSL